LSRKFITEKLPGFTSFSAWYNPAMSFVENLKQRAHKLKDEIRVLALAYRDPRTPWYARAFTALVVAYAFSPIDLIPDFIPVLGYLDDLVLVPLGITVALRMIPLEVMAESRLQVQAMGEQKKPVNWFFAGFVILLWAAILFLIAKAIFRF
jgi:uncharacterized membrane protein YkvA (DUF1232 family)